MGSGGCGAASRGTGDCFEIVLVCCGRARFGDAAVNPGKPEQAGAQQKQRRRLWCSCCANQAIDIDAHNLSLYAAGEILGSVGAWEGQSKTIVRDDGTVAKITGNCPPIVDTKQLRERRVPRG